MEETEILAPDQAGIARAAGLLREGRLVAFPTETVYGLGADARQARAVAEIFAAKGRPRFNPLIVHVTGLAAAERLVDLPETARKLAAAFWPGPLTLVMHRSPDLPDLVTGGADTVAVRMPGHPVPLELARRLGRPIPSKVQAEEESGAEALISQRPS